MKARLFSRVSAYSNALVKRNPLEVLESATAALPPCFAHVGMFCLNGFCLRDLVDVCVVTESILRV